MSSNQQSSRDTPVVLVGGLGHDDVIRHLVDSLSEGYDGV